MSISTGTAKDIVTSQAVKKVGARAERFQYEYQVLSHFNIDWADRNVRETAAMFRKYGQPEDIALLPDIGDRCNGSVSLPGR
jgi:hypothetical protein